MKQTDHEKKKKGKELLEELKIKRGGKVLDFHKRIANDPDLFTAFTQQYDLCYKNMTHLPPKTIEVHSKLALENGATIEELGETLRLVFFLAGEASLLLGAEVFEPLEMR